MKHRKTLLYLAIYNFFLKLSGIVLKMASLIKDSTLRVHKSRSEFYRKPPFKTFIIPADELVQVVAEVCLLLLITGDLFLRKFMSLRYMAGTLLEI